MKIGIVGLGTMGKGFAARLQKSDYTLYGYDSNEQMQERFTILGGVMKPLDELATYVDIIIILVPAGKAVADVIAQLTPTLNSKKIIIDAGNSYFKDSIFHAQQLKKRGVDFLDMGTSGGILGVSEGYSLTIGGEQSAFRQCEPLFMALAQENGYLYTGASGSGHYIKMVHNGIEYGILESYAEGFNLLKNGRFRDLDLAAIARTWNHGAIISSQLLKLSEAALADKALKTQSGIIEESGTARWTIEDAKNYDIPVPVIKEALKVRHESQNGKTSFATRYIEKMRSLFGGHRLL